MASVSWRYPADLILQANAPGPAETPKGPPVFKPETINLRYRLSGDKPDWRPLAVFDDGQQVFIEMPASIAKIEAPPLFVIGPEGVEIVNYRLRGTYYVVDRLFQKAELKIGSGWGAKSVIIERTTPIGGANG